MSHHCEIRVKFTHCRWGALTLLFVLLQVAFGQVGDAGRGEDVPVQFVTMFSSDADASGVRTPCQHLRDIVVPSRAATDVSGERPAVCDRVLDMIAGKADPLRADIVAPIQAAKVAVDSSLRVLITEPRTRTVHILDFASRKYFRIDGAKGDRMYFPYGVAVDASDNIYVTDLKAGRIAVYNPEGKFRKYLGKFKDEGAFELPRSIAIDRATGRIFVADTARNFVLILDLDGKILAQVGKRGGGTGPAEFREPLEVAIYGNEVFVLDRRNDRIQVLDLEGHFRREFNLAGSGVIAAKGMAFDTQGRLFVPNLEWVEVFNREGKFLFRFGESGSQPGEFRMLRGISTDSKDRVYVMDSGNRRIQVFQINDRAKATAELSP